MSLDLLDKKGKNPYLSTTMEKVITVENLRKNFGHINAVDGIDFYINKGEVVGLIGPNGAGKTTTMRLITGYLKATAGSVVVGGVDINTDTLKVRSQIGYLPENCPIYPEMEVTEYLSYVARLHHLEETELKKSIKEVVGVCGLKDVVGRPVGELSKGYRQRVGLAAAMVHHPSILILDEPTSGLDPNQIQEIRNLIKEVGKEKTVILSTHILQEVEAVCHRAIIISKGKIVGQGPLDELTKLSKGGHRYYVTIKAGQDSIKNAATRLNQVQLVDFKSGPGDEWQKAIFTSSNGGVKSEDIFKLVVDNGWSLKELYQDASSMEDVFRTLTQ